MTTDTTARIAVEGWAGETEAAVYAGHPGQTGAALLGLLREAAATPMTPEQEREQRISFVYGNVGMSNPSVTRQMVERVVDGAPAQEHPAADNDNAPERERIGDWMQTYVGKAVYPLDLRPSDIDIRDIAHALSMQCRYAGHVQRFYSVAEHSVHVARWCRQYGPDAALHGLLHDATEAYLVDVPRPVKPFLQGYKEAEAAAWDVIAERFDVLLHTPVVTEADNRILNDERAALMSRCEQEWTLPEYRPLGIQIECWSPARAKREFLALFDELYGED